MVSEIIRSPILRQYLIVISVNLSVLAIGIGLVWASPMLVRLRDPDDTVLAEPITDEQGAWVVSIGFLTGAIFNTMSSLVMDRIGFKYFIMAAMLPKVVASLLLLFANEVWHLILGRSLNGIADMFLFTAVPTYASDIASKEIRGALGTILQIMCSLGIVIMLSVGPFVSYFAANLLYVCSVLVALVPLPFLPESPVFLYKRGRVNESLKVLAFLRGCDDKANDEFKTYASSNTESVNKLEIIKKKLFWKSMTLVAVLVVGAQLVGFNAVQFYLQTILESTQTSVRPEIASVIIGLIQLSASLFTTIFTDKFGRKPILSSTLIGMMIGMICLGTFFFVTENADEIVGFMNFLPLIGLILVVFCFSAGTGSLNWALTAELFDNSSRALGMSISMVLSGLSTFFLTLYFPVLTESIGPAITYWVFGGNCILMCIFILVLVPETKGKTFDEIQRMLGARIPEDEEKAEKSENVG